MHQIQLLIISLLCFFTATSFGQGNSDNTMSVINLTKPDGGTNWNIPDKITLEWNTINIDTSKTIRFFLVRNEMVVQELGTFKNDGFEEGIELAKNIGSGSRYQVVTITNAASDERKKKQQLANTSSVSNQKKTKAKKAIAPKNTEVTQTEKKPVFRETFEGRKISYTKELQFDSENITIKIWDHGRQDGDIVSIYLNGVSVVSKYYLTYWKKEFNVKLDPKKSNDLFLYAHNLGDSPPNTVSVEISDGKKSENIVLNSDLQSCEAVLISVK